MEIKRYRIIYCGRVQGVGFRYQLSKIANKYNLTGFCQNLDDGNVLCEIQGENVDNFLFDSIKPDYFIDVDDYSYKSIQIKEKEKNFSIYY